MTWCQLQALAFVCTSGAPLLRLDAPILASCMVGGFFMVVGVMRWLLEREGSA